MEEIAEVIACNGDKALVKVKRRSACDKCNHNCILAGEAGAIEEEEMEFEVNNPVGAGRGQLVRLEMDEKPLVFASLLVYLLPVLFMIGGYYLGHYFFGNFFTGPSEKAGIAGAVLMLLISFSSLHVIDTRLLKHLKGFHPHISEILDRV